LAVSVERRALAAAARTLTVALSAVPPTDAVSVWLPAAKKRAVALSWPAALVAAAAGTNTSVASVLLKTVGAPTTGLCWAS
jgi:hypothetical protein